MTREKIFKLIDVERLPTLPAIAMEALKVMEGEKSGFRSVAELLRNDQVLVGRLLRYANSAMTGKSNIRNLDRALAVLGFNAVRSIILSSSIFDTFSPKNESQRKGVVNFWIHTIAVAETAEELARRLYFPESESAYLAGLLHDLGKLVLYCQLPEQFGRLCAVLAEQSDYSVHAESPLATEERILGINHLEVGKFIAELWKFPEAFVRVMTLHHQPICETILPEDTALPALIRFADVLCVCYNIGSSYFLADKITSHDSYHQALDNILYHHHLTREEIDPMMDGIVERVMNKGSFLGFWDEKAYRETIRKANTKLGDLSLNLEKNNRQLSTGNRVLDAIVTMARELTPTLATREMASRIATTAMKTFRNRQCLCLVFDVDDKIFRGVLMDGQTVRDISFPATLQADVRLDPLLAELPRPTDQLYPAAGIPVLGNLLADLFATALGSGRLLSSFFNCAGGPLAGQAPVLGHLAMDLGVDGDDQDTQNDEELRKNFQTFVVAVSTDLERIILVKKLERQTLELAGASRKVEENQRILFHTHRLATVGQLAAGAAHEINNPLTIISLNIQILDRAIRSLPDSQQMADRLTIISSQEERIAKIIRDLMGFAKPAAPQFQPSSVGDIIDSVLLVIGERLAASNIKIDNTIPADLPHVIVDPRQIEQVFMNLVINAQHAMAKGGTLTLRAKALRDTIEVVVIDSGTGIPQKYLSRIFDPFFTTKKAGKGTGLGLAISNTIVEHNGGTLRVQSIEGKGTAFTITLPIDKGEKLRAMKKALTEEIPIFEEKESGRYRILVIDDETMINNMLQDSLRAAGYEVDGAFDGLEGIEKLRYKRYQLILLDIRMPGKDGLEVLDFVKNSYPDIKVIIITGQNFKSEVQTALKKGAFACVGKPFRFDHLHEIITKALRGDDKINAFLESEKPSPFIH